MLFQPIFIYLLMLGILLLILLILMDQMP